MKKTRKIEGQGELDFSENYLVNNPPLDLSLYEKDRNYEFYKLQNEYYLEYIHTNKINKTILWKMFPFLEGVVKSLAKKNICAGCKVPDFEGKALDATLRLMAYYENHPQFLAKKIENVAFHKVREVFLDGNLQLNERTRDFDYILELEKEREKLELGEVNDDYN